VEASFLSEVPPSHTDDDPFLFFLIIWSKSCSFSLFGSLFGLLMMLPAGEEATDTEKI